MNILNKNEYFKVLNFKQMGDERGRLVVIESDKEDGVPFEIKRVFYIYGSDGQVVRGQHANKKSEFVLINLAGQSKVRIDNGSEQTVVILDKPHMGVYLPRMVWKDMYDFSEDSVLLVISNEHYDGTEYIRNYEEFKKMAKEGDK